MAEKGTQESQPKAPPISTRHKHIPRLCKGWTGLPTAGERVWSGGAFRISIEGLATHPPFLMQENVNSLITIT